VLRQLPANTDPNLLSAAIPCADAGIYRLDGKTALVQSVDFFTPIVDDPTHYGRIAAANALSDLYAVGARPLTVMNLVGFPPCLDKSVLVAILKGSAEKVAEAGATVVGGHTVEDDEPKFGLAVTGLVDPEAMVSTVGAQAGDLLILTKPLGTGLLATALKGEVLTETDMAEAIRGMSTLNRGASEAMLAVGVSACTDITGFGLLGHALELASASGVLIEIDGRSLPAYPHAFEMAAIGLIPAGSYNNREFYLPRLQDSARVAPELLDLIADPQTSGGLLIAVAPERVDQLTLRLSAGGAGSWRIGRILPGPAGCLRVV